MREPLRRDHYRPPSPPPSYQPRDRDWPGLWAGVALALAISILGFWTLFGIPGAPK